MILIGEAGGTKTDWRLIREGKISQFQTKGFNPIHHTSLPFEEQLSELDIDFESVADVHFYAAGIKTIEQKELVRAGLEMIFKNAATQIASDVLAAGRALVGRNPGWVGFLGTGSGLAYYDGENISRQIPSLGYILGDEGSGSYLGKLMVRDYLRNNMPLIIQKVLQPILGNEMEVITNVYLEKGGAQYLAGLTKVIQEHMSEIYMHELLDRSFNDYFDAFLPNKFDDSISFTGSIAFVFGDALRKVALNRGIVLGRIVQSPIAGLTLFHQEEQS